MSVLIAQCTEGFIPKPQEILSGPKVGDVLYRIERFGVNAWACQHEGRWDARGGSPKRGPFIEMILEMDLEWASVETRIYRGPNRKNEGIVHYRLVTLTPTDLNVVRLEFELRGLKMPGLIEGKL